MQFSSSSLFNPNALFGRPPLPDCRSCFRLDSNASRDFSKALSCKILQHFPTSCRWRSKLLWKEVSVFFFFTDSRHRFRTLRLVFVFFVYLRFGFLLSINKEIWLSSSYRLSLGTRFRQKSQNLASIHRFLRGKISVFSHFFTAYVRLMLEETFVKNRSNRSSVMQIP